MKKIMALVLALTCAVGTEEACAQEAKENSVGPIGVGYQAILLGELLQGVSVRYSPNDTPVMAQLIYGRFAGDIEGMDGSVDLYETRLAYVLTQRENSKFYVGGKAGYTAIEVEGYDVSGLTYGLLFGTEWHFTELPEIGYNFDVGYDFRDWDAEGNDLRISGIGVTLGVNYYF